MKRIALFLIFAFVCVAQIPQFVNYQGKLTDFGGIGQNDTLDLRFKIFDLAEDGDSLWAATIADVPIVNGLFDVNIGPIDLPFDEQYWLEVDVDGNVLSPRVQLTSSPYAFRSAVADSFTGGASPWTQDTMIAHWDSIRGVPEFDDNDWQIDGDDIYSLPSGNVGIGIDTPAEKLDIDGNARVSGITSSDILRLDPNADEPATPEVGMIKTTGNGSDYSVYSYDGSCWRKIYYPPDDSTCFGGTPSVNAGEDTTICLGTSIALSANVSDGWPPYEYDWDNDGTGDWDDLQTLVISPDVTTTFNIQIRDITDEIASDAVEVSIMDCNFVNSIGGTNWEDGYSVVQTSDGGYAIAGNTSSFGAGGYDAFLVKLRATGEMEWARAVGGTANDYSRCVVQTSDGGYTITGYTYGFGAGDYDIFLVKLSSAGALEWSRAIGGTCEDRSYSVVQTGDGGYAVAGHTKGFGSGAPPYSNLFLLKLSASGTLEWARTVGGADYDYCESVVQTNDGGYAVAGRTYSFGEGYSDLFLVKFSAAGTVEWSRAVGGADFDDGYSVVQTSDSGYAVAGNTASFGAGCNDLFIVKFSSTGTVEWSRAIGETELEYGRSVVQTTDGGYALAGYTNSFGVIDYAYDNFIVKLDSAGAVEWARTVGGTETDYCYSIVQTSDGGYAFTGSTTSFGIECDLFIVKFDSDGNSCLGETVSPTDTVTSPTETSSSPSTESFTPTITVSSPTVTVTSPTVTDCCP